MLRSIALALAAAAVGVTARDPWARLTKPPLTGSLDYLEAGLEQYLKDTPYTKNKWNNGYIPQHCKDIITGGSFAPGTYKPQDIDVYDVKYNDCGEPWVFCHHKNSNATIDSMARQFGKMPIQMREWIRHVIDVPADGGWAFETGGSITFIRPIDKMVTTMIHETGHSLDLSGAYNMPSLSNSDNWWDNYNQDPNVPDPYAQSNMVEDVAQVTVVSVFNENVPGKFESVEPNWPKIFHQYATLITQARNAGKGNSIIIPGENQQCTHRIPASQPVPKTNSAKARAALGVMPDVSLKSGVQEIDISHRDDSHTKCNLHW